MTCLAMLSRFHRSGEQVDLEQAGLEVRHAYGATSCLGAEATVRARPGNETSIAVKLAPDWHQPTPESEKVSRR